jgi:hypothetical protein
VDQGEFDRRLRRAVTLVVSVCALVVALALMAVADGSGPRLRAQTALGPFLGAGGEPSTVPSVPVETPVSRPNGGRARKPAPASIPPAPAATVSAAPPVEQTPATLLVRTVEAQPPAAPPTTTPTTGPRTPTTTPPTTTPGSTEPPPTKPPTKPPPTTVPPVTAGHGGHGEDDGGSGGDHDHEGGVHSRGHHRGDHDGSDHDGKDDHSGRNCPDGRRTS